MREKPRGLPASQLPLHVNARYFFAIAIFRGFAAATFGA